eukprot:m.52296 g.52296  ORF g.52296 m.52296 type:complete len:151 (+) comp48435_c0_seq1:920-1372(+)
MGFKIHVVNKVSEIGSFIPPSPSTIEAEKKSLAHLHADSSDRLRSVHVVSADTDDSQPSRVPPPYSAAMGELQGEDAVPDTPRRTLRYTRPPPYNLVLTSSLLSQFYREPIPQVSRAAPRDSAASEDGLDFEPPSYDRALRAISASPALP